MSRILIIDDDNAYRKVLKMNLEKAGYEVHDAPDIEKGLAITRKYFINLVITDLYMPETDGVQAITKFKNEFPGLRIMAMSGAAYSNGRTEYLLNLAKEKGAVDIYKKSDDIGLLCSKIQSILN